MSDTYVVDVIGFLRRNCQYYYTMTLRRSLEQMYGDLLLGRISTEAVATRLGAPALTDFTPEEWLDSTPLMRALQARLSRQ